MREDFYAIYHYVPFTDLCAEGGKNVGAFGYHGYHLPRPAGSERDRLRVVRKGGGAALPAGTGRAAARRSPSFGKLFREDEDGYTEVAG